MVISQYETNGVYDITEKYDREFSEEEKIKSWEYIFDVNGEFVKRDINIKPSIQATMWEIKKEWVKKAEHFLSR